MAVLSTAPPSRVGSMSISSCDSPKTSAPRAHISIASSWSRAIIPRVAPALQPLCSPPASVTSASCTNPTRTVCLAPEHPTRATATARAIPRSTSVPLTTASALTKRQPSYDWRRGIKPALGRQLHSSRKWQVTRRWPPRCHPWAPHYGVRVANLDSASRGGAGPPSSLGCPKYHRTPFAQLLVAYSFWGSVTFTSSVSSMYQSPVAKSMIRGTSPATKSSTIQPNPTNRDIR